MEEVALADINSFVSAPFPTTAADILNQILQRQEALERRVSELEAESRSKDATIEQLKANNQSLQENLNELAETSALEHAYDRKRITSLEEPAQPEPTQKTTDHIDNLHRSMKTHKLKQVSFAQAAKFLGIHHNHALRLRPLIALDDRFLITRDHHHRQRLLIRLRAYM